MTKLREFLRINLKVLFSRFISLSDSCFAHRIIYSRKQSDVHNFITILSTVMEIELFQRNLIRNVKK